jgi:hypothetical protein
MGQLLLNLNSVRSLFENSKVEVLVENHAVLLRWL